MPSSRANTSFGFANATIGCFSSYAQGSKGVEGDYVYDNTEGYIQDNWKVRHDLTINAAISNGKIVKNGTGLLLLNNSANSFTAGVDEVQSVTFAGAPTFGTPEAALAIWRDRFGFPVLLSEKVNGETILLTHMDLGSLKMPLGTTRGTNALLIVHDEDSQGDGGRCGRHRDG